MTFDFETIADATDYGFGTDYNPKHTVMAGAQLHVKTAPCIISALERFVSAGLYGWTSSDDELYLNTITDWMKQVRRWNIHNDWIVPSYGTLQAICAAIRAFTAVGDGIILQEPVYFLYNKAIENCGRKLVSNTLLLEGDHYKMDFDDLEDKLSKPENSLMILCNPHNPIMDIWEKDTLAHVAQLAKKHGVLVVVDEIFAEHVFDAHLMTPFATIEDAKDNCIVCTSIGKAFNFTGASHANIIIPNPEIRKVYKTQRDSDHYGSLSPFMRTALIAGYSQEGYDWIQALLDFSHSNVQQFSDFINRNMAGTKICRQRAGTLVWVDLRKLGLDENQLADLFAQANISPDMGTRYGKSGNGFVRLQLGISKKELTPALERLGKSAAQVLSQSI